MSGLSRIKDLVLRNPEVLYVKESINELSNLTQFLIEVPNEQDKFLLIYVIFRLKSIKGKGLVFLPFNSRYHAVEEFNKGIFDYLIATDESENNLPAGKNSTNPTPPPADPNLISTQPPTADKVASTEEVVINPKKRKNRDDGNSQSQDKPTNYGVSRGIDFANVTCVINFDLPLSSQSYTHRIGRTARAGRTGIRLSFVLSNPKLDPSSNKTNTNLQETCMRETEIWKKNRK
ncbi:hypothetical protein H4Q26_004351 [Puccinia striiformis f. sp. tritici PST-130]|nr:hypothetical protein H4Q26_004351 [Puccinia striiformis f. sp. tritici PST-130]